MGGSKPMGKSRRRHGETHVKKAKKVRASNYGPTMQVDEYFNWKITELSSGTL